ncbi:hypothetical protein C8R47DRAFT_1238631 [Mycena vitilis]|nr:hypothetical protein C8R47DRAFT_1238631 [Mycena vitilis]
MKLCLLNICILTAIQHLVNTLIPPELLCYIFTLSLATRTPTSPIVPVVGRNGWRDPWNPAWILGGPWIFGQVCSYWRQLAESLPTLWVGINISTVLSTRQATLLHTQLARTANAPLNLLIRFTSGQRSHRETPFGRFLATLVLHSARWRTLHMEFDDACGPHPAFGALHRDSLPLLEELVFTGRGVPYLRKYDFFRDAPRLRRVVLGDCGVSTVANVPLPYGQLATYKAIYPDVTTRLRVLSAASNLVECDMEFGPLGPTPYSALATKTVVTLPCLRRLAISHSEFLDFLVAPVLDALHVCRSVEHVLPFLHRSGRTASLAELTLAECSAHSPDVLAILQQTRGLTALAMDLHTPPSDIVAALARTGPERMCHRLGSLWWADFDDLLDRDAFVDMVASRCRGSIYSESQSKSSLDGGVRPLYLVAVYRGRLRMKGAGMRLRALPALEVVLMNAKTGKPAVADWRGYW